MYRIAIVEDDVSYRKELEDFLHRYEDENRTKFKIVSFSDGDEIAAGYKAEYDIILMDIEMRFMDGMKTAEYIRKLDEDVIIIFITNTPQYAMKGYMVDALDYCLKPLSYYAFSQRITKAIGRLGHRSSKCIVVNLKNGMQKVELSKLYYVEVLNHDLIFHTMDEEIVTRGTIAGIEEELKNEHFFRCSKCYLINLAFVENIKEYDVDVAGTVLQVSRSRKKALLDELNKYVSEAEV